MARIRTIKPEFFTSEDIVGLTPIARLLYIALWCEADREGRLSWKPKTFKMRYFPGDSVNIEKLCDEVRSSGLALVYIVNDIEYAFIPTFHCHQHINPREAASVLPEPPANVITTRASRVTDASAPVSDAQVGRGGKGKEGKGREGNEIATPDGVSDSVFQDFKKLRTAKKSPLTQTALDGITREAAKAGLPLSTVLEMCCERGWVGFKAEWTLEKETAKSTETAYQKSMRLRVAEVSPELAKQAPEENPINFFKTIDVESRRIA